MKGAHPSHPKCPKCGKAMYKSAVKGVQVKKADPWAFCRNEACELCAQNQTKLDDDTDRYRAASQRLKRDKEREFGPKRKTHKKAPKKRRPASPPRSPKQDADPTPEPTPEPESVVRARDRIRDLLNKAVSEDTDKTTVGIVLAIVSQETGNQAAANALIDEYKLDERLGIQKR